MKSSITIKEAVADYAKLIWMNIDTPLTIDIVQSCKRYVENNLQVSKNLNLNSIRSYLKSIKYSDAQPHFNTRKWYIFDLLDKWLSPVNPTESDKRYISEYHRKHSSNTSVSVSSNTLSTIMFAGIIIICIIAYITR